jgi:hypothetical protein
MVPRYEPAIKFVSRRWGYWIWGAHANTFDMGHAKLLAYEARGRYPSNVMHDRSPEVLAEFAKAGTSRSDSTSS